MPRSFNPLSKSFLADPYPHYEALRAREPVHWTFMQNWAVTSHAHCLEVLKAPERFSSKQTQRSAFDADPRFESEDGQCVKELAEGMLIFTDPPEHTRVRRLMSQVFTPKRTHQMSDWIQSIVDARLDALEDNDGGNLMEIFAYELPSEVICQLLGIPLSDRPLLRKLSAAIAPSFSPVMLERDVQPANAAAREFRDYLRDLAEVRRRSPGDDLYSSMVHHVEAGDRLSEFELLTNGVLLFFAGHETTVHLIGNGTMALLSHPQAAEQVRSANVDMKPAVEELLRWDSPFQIVYRVADGDQELAGQSIKSGDLLLVYLGAANRDPEVFADPNALQLERRENPHFGFGAGRHLCLGAYLARVEVQIALQSLFRRFPELKLEGSPVRRENRLLRGFETLPVRLA